MDGNIFLKEGSATNTIPQERLGRKLGAPVRLMPLGRGTWPLYMTRPPMTSCTLSPPSTASLEEQMRGPRVIGGGVMELPGITRTGPEASQTTVKAVNIIFSSSPLANGTMVGMVLIPSYVSQHQVYQIQKKFILRNLLENLLIIINV